MSRTLNHDEFVRRAILANPGKTPGTAEYEYHTKINVFCREPEHGLFLVTPANHLRGRGCSKCKNIRRAASKLGITIWQYREMIQNDQRYCKVHGFQDI
jgi:hypothetical protein